MKPSVQNLDQIIAELNPAYDTSRNLVQSQINAIPGKYQAQTQSLTAAKDNAFTQINTNANSKGAAFTGAPTVEQQRYIGEKFLPGLTNLQTQQNTEQLQLNSALADINKEQRLRAMDTRTGQEKALQAYIQAEQERQFQREQAYASSSAKSANTTDLSIRKNGSGGYEVIENGKVSKNYYHATASGLLGKDLISLLAQGDAKDRQAAKYYQDNIRLGRGEAYAKQQLLKDRSTAFFLGGYY